MVLGEASRAVVMRAVVLRARGGGMRCKDRVTTAEVQHVITTRVTRGCLPPIADIIIVAITIHDGLQ